MRTLRTFYCRPFSWRQLVRSFVMMYETFPSFCLPSPSPVKLSTALASLSDDLSNTGRSLTNACLSVYTKSNYLNIGEGGKAIHVGSKHDLWMQVSSSLLPWFLPRFFHLWMKISLNTRGYPSLRHLSRAHFGAKSSALTYSRGPGIPYAELNLGLNFGR